MSLRKPLGPTRAQRRETVALVPAAGFGVRMTPTWNISDPMVDFVAKPALRETFSGKTLLDMVLDNIEKSRLVSKTMVRIGDTPDRIEHEPSEFLRAMKRKAREDILTVIGGRRNVVPFHNNPDGADDGTGATVVSREAKRLVAAEKGTKCVLFVASDLPTLSGEHIRGLLSAHMRDGNDVTLSSVREPDPSGHGRIVRYPMMFLGTASNASERGARESESARHLNALMRRGELIVLRLENARVPQGAPWAEYLVLQGGELRELRERGQVELFHPLRGVIPGDRLRVNSELVGRCRVAIPDGHRALWDLRSGRFLAVVEQSQIGVSADDRDKRRELTIEGFESPLSTEFLHSIKERNVLCMVVSKRVFERTIRDLDAPSYGRVVSAGGKEVIVPNLDLRSGRGFTLVVDGVEVSRRAALSSLRCVRLSSDSRGYYVLERHGDNEYYLPEVANRVASSGGRVGVYELPEGSAEGLDTRTDLRRLSDLLMSRFVQRLASGGVDVTSLESLRATGGFSPKFAATGCRLRGFVHLSGKLRIEAGAEVEDSFVESTVRGRTRVGRRARILRSVVRDSVIGVGSTVEDSFIEGVNLPAGSVVRGKRVTRKGRGHEEEGACTPGARDPSLVEAGDDELRVIEEVFGVTIHPRSHLRLSQGAMRVLSGLAKLIRIVGGSKRFVSLYADPLKRGAFDEILRDSSVPALGLRLSPNVTISSDVSLSGSVEVGPGVALERCTIRDSELGSCATIRSSEIENCRVESSVDTPTVVEAQAIRGQVVEAGHPSEHELAQGAQPRPIAEWMRYLNSEEANRQLKAIYGSDVGLLAERRNRLLDVLRHASICLGGDSRVIVVRVPGRVNLMGRHVDHRGGFVNPITIPREMLLVAKPREDSIVTVENVDRSYPAFSFDLMSGGPDHRVSSLQEWRDWVQSQLERRRKEGVSADWSDYCRSAVYLQNYYLRRDGSALRKLRGADIVVSGDIPVSVGLSSSSAIVVGTYMTLATLNGLRISEERFVELCGDGEWYVGTRGGCGDHAAMVWGRLGKVSHIGFFPLTVSWATMPRGIKAVVCNSLVEAKKTAGAKDMFNEKVATSDIALMLFRRRYPHLATKLKRMRDLNPSNLGVSLSQFYGMLKSLPLSATREELRKVLSAHARDIERLFREHAEPSAGYAVRGVALFVASECERSRIAPEAVAQGPERLGLLMKVSHNGDREVVHLNGKGKRWTVPIDNRYLDELSRMSSHRVPEGVRLHMQSGSYGCGHERTDMLVDIALSVPGVLGAQLVGAGLGGSVVVLVREQSVEALLSSLAAGFYGSREEAIRNTVMCTPIGGASVLRFGSPS